MTDDLDARFLAAAHYAALAGLACSFGAGMASVTEQIGKEDARRMLADFELERMRRESELQIAIAQRNYARYTAIVGLITDDPPEIDP